jgi:hypothetical protein
MSDYAEPLIAAQRLLKHASYAAAERNYSQAIGYVMDAKNKMRFAIHSLNELYSVQKGVLSDENTNRTTSLCPARAEDAAERLSALPPHD